MRSCLDNVGFVVRRLVSNGRPVKPESHGDKGFIARWRSPKRMMKRCQTRGHWIFYVVSADNEEKNMAHFSLDAPKTTTPRSVIIFYNRGPCWDVDLPLSPHRRLSSLSVGWAMMRTERNMTCAWEVVRGGAASLGWAYGGSVFVRAWRNFWWCAGGSWDGDLYFV